MTAKLTRRAFVISAMVAPSLASRTAFAADKKTVIGNFPTPLPYHAFLPEFAKETGRQIDWRRFNAGTEVIAAMASGDIKIAELGSPPMVIGASQGVDYQLFALSDVIGSAESLIARNGSGIERVTDLRNKNVGVPLGTTSHYSLMGALANAGMSSADLHVIGMKPGQIVAAWERGQIDATFIWDPIKSEVLKTGKVIMNANQVTGYGTFDGWVVDRAFGEANADFIVGFLKALDAANEAYRAHVSAWTAESAEVRALAMDVGANPADVPAALSEYVFPTLPEMASEAWLGGGVQKNMLATAKFLKENNRIDTMLPDYGKFVNVDYLKVAIK